MPVNLSLQPDIGSCPALVPHPILVTAPRPARALPLALSSLLSGLVLTGLFYLQLGRAGQAFAGAGGAPVLRTASVLLSELLPLPPAPVEELSPGPKDPPGPGQELGAPGLGHLKDLTGPGTGLGIPGVGNIHGNDAIDPDLLALPQSTDPNGIPADRSLPVRRGGNGLAKGTVRDVGAGGGWGGGGRPIPDFKLVPIHREPAWSRLPATDPDLTLPVRVRILVGADGIPFQAVAIAGPQRLYQECVDAALRWRFEPLAPHGLTAPCDLVLIFHPQSRAGGPRSRAPQLF